MTTLQLIIHCWAGQLPQYAHFLRYQLSSLRMFPPQECRVQYTLCCASEDSLTLRVWDAFLQRTTQPPNVEFCYHVMPHDYLMRRAIGRNACALASMADVVWFGGVDYVFGNGCLDAVAAAAARYSQAILFPRQILASRNHADGDQAVEFAKQQSWGSPLAVNRPEFKPARVKRPIGCLQIVEGDVARKYGYAPHLARYHKPSNRWRRTFEDGKYRKWIIQVAKLRQMSIDVPQLFRLRHSQQGRFTNIDGSPRK